MTNESERIMALSRHVKDIGSCHECSAAAEALRAYANITKAKEEDPIPGERAAFIEWCRRNCSSGADSSAWYWQLFQAGVSFAMSSQQPPDVQAWQPIETAPKDGADMLLAKYVGHTAHSTALWWVVKGSWSLKWKKWWDGIEPCGLAGPTHWMPLPAPPIDAARATVKK